MPDGNAPGFRHFTIRPNFVGGVEHVKAFHNAPLGKIEVEWKRTEQKVRLYLTIPAEAAADVILPGRKIAAVRGSVKLEADIQETAAPN